MIGGKGYLEFSGKDFEQLGTGGFGTAIKINCAQIPSNPINEIKSENCIGNTNYVIKVFEKPRSDLIDTLKSEIDIALKFGEEITKDEENKIKFKNLMYAVEKIDLTKDIIKLIHETMIIHKPKEAYAVDNFFSMDDSPGTGLLMPKYDIDLFDYNEVEKDYLIKNDHTYEKMNIKNKIITDIYKGVYYLHNYFGYGHFDIKLENVMLQYNLEEKIINAVLIDYGFMKPLYEGIDTDNFLLTKDKTTLTPFSYTKFEGTPQYISKEIWERVPYSKDADIWALGILIGEILTYRNWADYYKSQEEIYTVLKNKFHDVSNFYRQINMPSFKIGDKNIDIGEFILIFIHFNQNKRIENFDNLPNADEIKDITLDDEDMQHLNTLLTFREQQKLIKEQKKKN